MGYALLGPVLALVGWTFVMWIWLYAKRLPAMAEAKPTDEQLQDKANLAKLPDGARFAGENYNHLFEMPVLFYVLCIVATLMTRGDDITVALAWVYVALRVIHSLIHVTYNKVKHRFAVFSLSGIVLAILFIRLAIDYWSA
jgi:hypothetical protein